MLKGLVKVTKFLDKAGNIEFWLKGPCFTPWTVLKRIVTCESVRSSCLIATAVLRVDPFTRHVTACLSPTHFFQHSSYFPLLPIGVSCHATVCLEGESNCRLHEDNIQLLNNNPPVNIPAAPLPRLQVWIPEEINSNPEASPVDKTPIMWELLTGWKTSASRPICVGLVGGLIARKLLYERFETNSWIAGHLRTLYQLQRLFSFERYESTIAFDELERIKEEVVWIYFSLLIQN
jgi:hypothetical protein